MNKPYFIAFLLFLALWTAIPSVFAGDVVLKVFEGKPRINSPHIIGNYPSTPFIFYIPTSGQRPMQCGRGHGPQRRLHRSECGHRLRRYGCAAAREGIRYAARHSG